MNTQAQRHPIRRRGGLALLVAGGAGTLALAACVPLKSPPPAPPQPQLFSQTFSCTGASQSFTVPAGVTGVAIEVLGAQGGAGRNATNGGLGGRAFGGVAVTPGEVLQVNIGCQGTTSDGVDTSPGGFGGAGDARGGDSTTSATNGGGGGGASDVRRSSTVLLQAGGGGGGSFSSAAGGGSGGGTTGTAGSTIAACSASTPGTDSAPGAGAPVCAGVSGGSSGVGGNGGASAQSGGGGGGHFGGGGGASGAGAGASGGSGGSGFVHPSATSAEQGTGVRAGNGQVIIAWFA